MAGNQFKGITIEEVREVIQDEIKPLVDKMEEHEGKINEHDRYIIRGGDQPSLLEDMRTVKSYQAEQKAWMKSIALIFISQFIVVMGGLVYLLIQVAPILKNLSEVSLK